MTRAWMLFLLLSGCPKEAMVSRGQAPDDPVMATNSTGSSGLRTLVGLYEGGGDPAHQMCVVERGREHGFGLVVWGGNNHSCSGSGTISRNREHVELKMAGDSPCTISGRISGRTIRLADTQPAGCSYYCGARARLAGASLTQTGSTRADALEAKDLVGEPLCSAM